MASPTDYTCRCRAYKFPHRFGGGRCTGFHIVEEHWNTYYGHGSVCKFCNALNEDTRTCDVTTGGDDVRHCEALIEFKSLHSIK